MPLEGCEDCQKTLERFCISVHLNIAEIPALMLYSTFVEGSFVKWAVIIRIKDFIYFIIRILSEQNYSPEMLKISDPGFNL